MNTFFKRSKQRAFGSRIWILVGLLFCLPVISYTALELSRLDEQESLLQDLYRAQLSAILFSVNQYCWDVVNGWGNTLRAELGLANAAPHNSASVAARLLQVQRRHGAILAAFFYESEHMTLALPDSLSPQREQLALHIASLLKENRSALVRMQEHAGKGYFRPEAMSFGKENAEQDTLLFVFAEEKERLQGVLLSSRTFVNEILRPKIAEFASKNFVLAVTQTGRRAVLLSTQQESKNDFEYDEPLWIFPNLSLAIKLQGANAAQIAATRTRRTLFLLLGMDAVILVAIFMIVRVLAREARLARLKSDFVDNVSHDLRTPLGLIRMYADTLQMGRVNSEERKAEYYGILAREAERLTRMVNNLLDFSRLEAGRKVYEPKIIALTEVVTEVLDSYRHHLQQRSFVLSTKISPEGLLIKADPEAVSQAFVNLLDNAVKYSDERKHITVAVFQEENRAIVEVADRGIGIAPEHLQKIFDKFYRVEAVGHDTRGAGIGLALVQHVMAAHAGSVEVRSELGKGSSFYLKFPIADKP